jgi:hypothetical protein
MSNWAFPLSGVSNGLNKRELFAVIALGALLTKDFADNADTAKRAVRQADNLLKALES